MQRGKKSILNATAAMLLTLMNGLLGMVVTKLVIDVFGSDFNGLNSTASQLVNILLLLEGGFTIATNVAMFHPYYAGDYDRVNQILSATHKTFRKIGIIFLGAGVAVAAGYTLVVNSGLPAELIFTVMMMAIVPAAFNLFFATKYRILLQADQKEYIISLITLLTITLGHIINIILVLCSGKMWMIRAVTMVMAIINSILIGFYVKKHYRFLDFKAKPDFSAIQGTKDVMIQKITGVIYNTAPIVFISISADGGTLLASVYAVYNNVFVLLKGVMQGLIDAPRLGLGEMMATKKREEVWPTFKLYQFIVFMALFILLTTAAVLIIPFVAVYTHGVSDTNYEKPIIALLLVCITFFEMIHIPSGHMINMSGNFRISKQIQIVATITLIFTMSAGVLIAGIYGILCSVLLTAIILAILEIGFIHCRFFTKKIKSLLGLLLPFAITAVPLGILELKLLPKIDGYLSFFICAFILAVGNSIIAFVLGMLFNRQQTMEAFTKILRIVHLGK
ncbi:hypothetical protein [Gehongia tenuis]|uniref:Polysaccharide biosynthesis protein C-terminal domain-containing protein n=1 Tax=Gehongia tenuis TaxID=2763655 RepID=A0A926D608_9FIRM|nr:hypothetical protein [Gehongia tenuis]MBC8532358.1 hypothetical protein [Gehongia tenuis]